MGNKTYNYTTTAINETVVNDITKTLNEGFHIYGVTTEEPGSDKTGHSYKYIVKISGVPEERLNDKIIGYEKQIPEKGKVDNTKPATLKDILNRYKFKRDDLRQTKDYNPLSKDD